MGNLAFIVAAAVATYATRIGGFALGGRELPPLLGRFLAYVPIAVFAALVTPELGLGEAEWVARSLGIVAAAIAAWRIRQLWAGLLAGMLIFWLVRGLGG